MWKWRERDMTRKCPAVVKSWKSLTLRGMDGYQSCDWSYFKCQQQWTFPLPVNWALKDGIEGPFLNCSLRYKYRKSASLVKALHFVMFGLFLSNCITPFLLICKNVVYCYWYLSVVPCIFLLNTWICFQGIWNMTALHCKEYLNITESVIVTLWRPAKRTKKSPNDIVINVGDY